MKSVYYQIIIWVGFLIVILTLLRISFNFEGVMSEIGKYPFASILNDADYIGKWVISSLYKAMHLSCTVLI